MIQILLINERRIMIRQRKLNIRQRARMRHDSAVEGMQRSQRPRTMILIRNAMRVDDIQLIIVYHRPHNPIAPPPDLDLSLRDAAFGFPPGGRAVDFLVQVWEGNKALHLIETVVAGVAGVFVGPFALGLPCVRLAVGFGRSFGSRRAVAVVLLFYERCTAAGCEEDESCGDAAEQHDVER